jgi:hypothetical protein
MLAAQFIRAGWSHGPSADRPVRMPAIEFGERRESESLVRDPDGRLLSAIPPLDAEAIRDSIQCSDDLDRSLYGPYVATTRQEVTAREFPGARRRSIYLNHRRTQVVSLLAVFDSPSIVFNSISRPRSTMPLQALSLLNSDFAVNRARSLADDLFATQPASEEGRVESSYLRILGRRSRTNRRDRVRHRAVTWFRATPSRSAERSPTSAKC